ncbi:MAG: hypothetical protein MJ102_05590 [Clostridia bacterium]|nr:hypothetical protein [Clostridia bacterium]
MEGQHEEKKSLDFLKKLEEYSFDSKMTIAQRFSSRIMGQAGITPESCSKYNSIIAPSEIEIFTLYSIVFDSARAKRCITESEFCGFITGIRNYWPSMLNMEGEQTKLGSDLFMLLALQQFSVEGAFLIKLFRYNYFFHFCNERVDVQTKFIHHFGCDYDEYAAVAYILYHLPCGEMSEFHQRVFYCS